MVDDIPNNVGKKGAFTWDETEHPYKVIKEIVKIKQDNPNVALCLQQIQLDDSTRLRFCYCNKKKGKWVVARTAPHMFPEEFQSIVLKAINEGWIETKSGNLAGIYLNEVAEEDEG